MQIVERRAQLPRVPLDLHLREARAAGRLLDPLGDEAAEIATRGKLHDDADEDLDEIGNLMSIHDIIANKNHSTGSKLRKQESEIDGRFNYATGCDGAQVVYRQCIGSCLIPIFSILKEFFFIGTFSIRLNYTMRFIILSTILN